MRSDKEEEIRRRARGETLEFWGRSDVHDSECAPEIDVVEEEVLTACENPTKSKEIG